MNLITSLWDAISSGNFYQFFTILFNQYFPFGSFFWLLGLTLFVVIHLKTKNLGFSGMVASVYYVVMGSSGIVVNVYSSMGMKYFGIILGVIVGWYLYRAIKGE